MNQWIRSMMLAALAVPLFSTTGCAGTGTMQDVLGVGLPGLGTEVRGEVRNVDTRRQRITVRTSRRQEVISYDSRTQVVAGRQRYPVSALGRGDHVSIRVDHDRRGNLRASRIQLRDGRLARRGDVARGRARLQRFEGEVRQIDRRQGRFVVRDRRGSVVVTLPYNAGRGVEERFRRLRNGQRVRIEGQILNQNRIELRRFL